MDRKHFSIPAALLGLFLVASPWSLRAQITVEGIADRQVYNNAVSFRVLTEPNFTYRAWLNGEPTPLNVLVAVNRMDYYDLVVQRMPTAGGAIQSQRTRFIVLSSNRGSPEQGLIEWTPYPTVDSTASEFAGARLHIVAPREFPANLQVPLIAWVEQPDGQLRRANGKVAGLGLEDYPIQLRRGIGSGFLPGFSESGLVVFRAGIHGLTTNKYITLVDPINWSQASGVLTGSVTWAENARIHVTGHLTVPAGTTLTIEQGTIVKLNPLMNITNNGRVVINGTTDRPVVFTATGSVKPEQRTYAWGGFVMRGNGVELLANGTIFYGGGGAPNWSYPSPLESHRDEQSVFFVNYGARAMFTNCYILNTAGQVANGYNSDFTYDHCLIQKAVTAGEYSGGTIILNHSALIEFPEENGIVNATIANDDYDGIYFTRGIHILQNSLFGFCKDDAIDSGSGTDGSVVVSNCWVESALHEALAWSGENRVTETRDTVLMNSGQGIEAGWSQGSGVSPDVFAERLLSLGNSVGARFGDNYNWTYNGSLEVTNSLILHNYRDIWGMNWADWTYRVAQMDLRGNFVTQANTNHPANNLWNPATDGWRLAAFMTTPPNAPVGIGIAVWTNRFPINRIFEGIPVRLSSFTTNTVTVDYAFSDGESLLGTGTLSFAPGETLKRISTAGANLTGKTLVEVSLSNPQNGEVTGTNAVLYQGTLLVPQLVSPFTTRQGDVTRLEQDLAFGLTGPSAQTVSFAFQAETPEGLLTNGTVTIESGQLWTVLPGLNIQGANLVRVRLENLVGANFTGPTNIYLIPPAPSTGATNFTLIPRNAVWKYHDQGQDLGTGWRARNYDDESWPSGPAELGRGDGGEPTQIDIGPSGNRYPTLYFRKDFMLTNAEEIVRLEWALLRDDGAVVYINGQELFRDNMPSGTITYNTYTGRNTPSETAYAPGSTNATGLVNGFNICAVEVHNDSATSSDISFDLELRAATAPPAPVSQRIYFGEFDGRLVLVWDHPSYQLQQTEEVTSGWSNAGVTSPAEIPITGGQKFFRLRRP